MTHRTSEMSFNMLVFGLMAGAAGALLFAPRSGRETREKVKEMGLKFQDEAMSRKDHMVDKVKEGLDKAKTEVGDKADMASEKMEAIKGSRGRKGSNNELSRSTPYTDNTEAII